MFPIKYIHIRRLKLLSTLLDRRTLLHHNIIKNFTNTEGRAADTAGRQEFHPPITRQVVDKRPSTTAGSVE